MLSHIQFFATPWAVAHQAPLSMDFLGRILQWVAIPFSRELFLHPGTEPGSPLQADSWFPFNWVIYYILIGNADE